ncbi:MAG: UxaA family hydrolase [Synergistaceae bacterium]|nr:UxaA family hydrolase [Synergistaceae bacterium]
MGIERGTFMQRAFVISSQDNVATALEELQPGGVSLLGDAIDSRAEAVEKIPKGHKLALRTIGSGEMIIKYGVVIGQSIVDISAGSWVHLHNIRSVYDERSSHLDIHTGAPKDTEYE